MIKQLQEVSTILVIMLEDRGTWNLYVLAVLLCMVLLYGLLLKEKTRPLQPILFLTSVCLFYVLIGSPLTMFIELSFSLHMIHMSVLYFILPPLFLLGIPNDMYERFFSKIKKLAFLPAIHALYLFSILLFLYHIPSIFNFISQYEIYLNGYKIILFILAFMMWWPIVAPSPKERLREHALKRYIFKCGIWITPACLFFIVTSFIPAESNAFLTQMSAHLCIPPNESFDGLPPFFQSKTDQFMAGVCMFGLHKFGLLMTSKLEQYKRPRLKNK